jgi:transglutaminase-like putative cysteine protease
MNRYKLFHITEFEYDGPVTESYNEVRLRPMHDERQSCLSFRLVTTPDTRAVTFADYFGNTVHQFNVLSEHRHLSVKVESVVLVHEEPPVPERGGATLSDLDAAQEKMQEDFFELLVTSAFVPHRPELRLFMHEAERECDGSIGGFLETACRIVHQTFRYEKGATHVHSTVEDTLQSGAGVCQDFAHILLGVLRLRGIPARYVSGYMVPRRTAEAGASVEEVIGGQASHAWVEAWTPDRGWLSLDPTLGARVTARHVRLAYGRDYGDVPPVRGVYKGHAGQRLSVDVRVRPALDDEGREHMQEITAAPPEPPITTGSAQQPQQQQQQ